MKKYYIEVFYQTGDSYKLYDHTEDLGLTWDNLDVAKENLKRLVAHHKWYESVNNNWNNSPVLPMPSFVDAKHSGLYFNLITDDGKDCKIGASWCGHFERLHHAKIKENEDPELVYNP